MKNLKKNLYVDIGVRHGWLLVFYIVSAIMINVAVMGGNDYLARAIDTLLKGGVVDFGEFYAPLTVLIVMGTVMSFVKSICRNDYSARVQRDVRSRIGEHLLKLPYSYYNDKGTGSIMTKLVSDVSEVGRFFSEVMPYLIIDIITVASIAIYIGMMNLQLVCVLFLSYPMLLIAAERLSRWLTSFAKKRRDSIDKRTQIAYDAIQGMAVVRSYNLYEIIQKKINYYIDDVAEQGCRSTKITSAGYVLRHTVNTIPVVLCYLFALFETIQGRMTVGDMLAFNMLLNRILWHMGNIVFCVNDIREVKVSLRRVQEIYEQEPEQSGIGKFDMVTCGGNVIEWKDVVFFYDEKRKVINAMSLEIQEKVTVAIVGGSGEGKSTIFRLLCGFYQKNSGSYKLFNHEYEEWNIEAARNCFSYVSQNVFLFPKTIWQNVAYGKENATKDEVIKACKNANIHDFIMELPKGYDTVVGERGVRLSGGERQRISVARAFLKNAPIILLDEPTAAVDVGTEALLQEAISRVSQDRTVIVIAHRLLTVQRADRIFVVKDGQIVESGRHAELLAKNGIYAIMFGKEVVGDESENK